MYGLPPSGSPGATSQLKFGIKNPFAPRTDFSNAGHTPRGGSPGSSPSSSSSGSGSSGYSGGSTQAVSQTDEAEAGKHFGLSRSRSARRFTRGNAGDKEEVTYKQGKLGGRTVNIVTDGSGNVELDEYGHYQTVDADTGEVTRSKDTWFNAR